MNFLAHLFLSGNDDDIKIGNYIGDFVKGNQLNKYPKGIRDGILLHRKIDHFTDNHPVVLESKKRLRPRYRHYAPVIVDMYYDHFLAANWKDYSYLELKQFTSGFYDLAWSKSDLLPDQVIHLLTHMSSTDWLFHYKDLEGIDRALKGMARRTKFHSGMDEAVRELEQSYQLFLNEFQQFFPELMNYCRYD